MVHFKSLHTSYRTRKLIQFFDAVDRILRQQKETQAAAESKVKGNQNIVHALHPLGAGIKQLPDSGSHAISPQQELSQATDKLGRIPNSSTSNDNTLQNLKRAMGSLGSTPPVLAALRGLATSPFPIPSTSEKLIEHKTPAISGISGTVESSSPAVTPLSHICASIVL